MRILFELGDRWSDGHGKWEHIAVETNYTEEQMRNAIRKQKIFDINKECSEYEDSTLSPKLVKKLVEIGAIEIYDEDFGGSRVATKSDIPKEVDPECFHLEEGASSYVEYLMKVLQHLDKDFHWQIVEDTSPTIDIGGYGLFGN